jgi:hypothetical protein
MGKISLLHSIHAAFGPTQTSLYCVPGPLSFDIKQPGLEADLTSSSSAEVKNGGAIPPFSSKSSWRGA